MSKLFNQVENYMSKQYSYYPNPRTGKTGFSDTAKWPSYGAVLLWTAIIVFSLYQYILNF